MPSEKMYMEHSIAGGPSKGNDTSQWTYEDTAVGEETLNGMKVTKYKTIATSTDGKKFGGFSWRTKEGINLKQDLLYKEGNDKKRMLTELSNVKIGRQDPKLFEIPDGFTKFDMGGMMGAWVARHGPSRSADGAAGHERDAATEYARARHEARSRDPARASGFGAGTASQVGRGQGHQFHEGPVRPIGEL